MKTKICAIALSAIMAMGTMSILSGCGFRDSEGEKVNPEQTQIRVGYYDGGLGRTWIQEAEKIYEAEHPDIQIMVTYEKKRYESNSMLASYSSYNEDIFLVDSAVYGDFKNENFYYDITEAVSTPLTEYGETKSILDKLDPIFKNYYNEGTDDSSKYLALPYYQAFYTIVYDVGLFEEKFLYMDGQGGYSNGSVKSVGKDGIAGTYDDGLPTTMDEFFELCDLMLSKGITPFTWNGTDGYYPTKMLENLWASYEGYDNYLLNYTLDSNGENYKFLDGSEEPVTYENGYKLKNGQPGKEFALQFGYELLKGQQGKYHSDKIFALGQDNRAAQDEFLFSVESSSPVAFLIDAAWWERESIESFKALEKRTDSSNAYGTREFGLMPMPSVHEGGGEEEIYSAVGENSQIFINKNTKVPEEAVDFFRFLHTDRIMSLMTGENNTTRPFDYSVSDADRAKMTPFGKQLAEVMDVAKCVAPLGQNDFVKSCDFYAWQQWQFGTTGTNFYPLTVFNNNSSMTVADYIKQMAIDPTKWSAELEKWEANE